MSWLLGPKRRSSPHKHCGPTARPPSPQRSPAARLERFCPQAGLEELEKAKRSGAQYKPFLHKNVAAVGEWSPLSRSRTLQSRRDERARTHAQVLSRRSLLVPEWDLLGAPGMSSSPRGTSRCAVSAGSSACERQREPSASPRSVATPTAPRPLPPDPKTHKGRARRLASQIGRELR